MKTLKPLRPFDQEDTKYFEGFAQLSIEEKIENIEITHSFLSGCLNTEFDKKDVEACSTHARLSRINLRDIQKNIKLTMKHLEVIEATGEWK